ncbi:hypothetical protein [Bacillus salipaludis]|uniref:Uncharacterized protein n=1 Tax=Bacillus salipaludis TaxID=2547811 RepID=A0AA90R6Z5_9BACI|nr:hypothetical protein [Bacillus salipaludis]MDQ6600605.1 hypothetical protein [Bacillus salipaludis]
MGKNSHFFLIEFTYHLFFSERNRLRNEKAEGDFPPPAFSLNVTPIH